MQHLLLFVLTLSFFLFGPVPRVSAQPEERTYYLKIDYFRAPPETISEYVQVEQELWKPIHQARYDNGIISGWTLYSLFVGEPDAGYNYIAVNVFEDFNRIDYYRLNELVSSVYPDRSPGAFFDQTRASREVVRTELWKVETSVQPEGREFPDGPYVAAHFYDFPENTGTAEEARPELREPVSQTRLEEKHMNGRGVFTLLYPKGKARLYSSAIFDFHNRFGDLLPEGDANHAAAGSDNRSAEEHLFGDDQPGGHPHLYKTEIWKRVDSVGHDR